MLFLLPCYQALEPLSPLTVIDMRNVPILERILVLAAFASDRIMFGSGYPALRWTSSILAIFETCYTGHKNAFAKYQEQERHCSHFANFQCNFSGFQLKIR
ncbi:hypothetical protein PoMZ_04800 [Pyricularia oryzae]|uniref:Uncharacterized protein n=1 Tax=Pyricularia oryzae TaxID=318829 RepID=A0A4P7NDD9_PYROR|nr:hypothetical protein PoMZ_04800 [Pyricularia oryzae]